MRLLPMMETGDKFLSDKKTWVLVIEDGSVLNSGTRCMLEQCGYRVYSAESGDEAVECYKTARECGYPFDAVILSVSRIESGDGWEAIKKLHGLDPEVRVIIAGGKRDRLAEISAGEHGFHVALANPFSGEEVDRVLHSMLTACTERA